MMSAKLKEESSSTPMKSRLNMESLSIGCAKDAKNDGLFTSLIGLSSKSNMPFICRQNGAVIHELGNAGPSWHTTGPPETRPAFATIFIFPGGMNDERQTLRNAGHIRPVHRIGPAESRRGKNQNGFLHPPGT